MAPSTLADWANFYVITGSAAAGLTGLTFVVIALAADAHRLSTTGLRAFVTPTIVHFGTVLALAAYLCMPRQGVMSLSLGFGAAGAAGLIYAGISGVSMRRIGSAYVPVGEDWLWHVVFPAVLYAVLSAAAFLIWRRLQLALYGVAAASLLLLFVGIHNAWDVATSISVRKQQESD
jgi:hypothetical protein